MKRRIILTLCLLFLLLSLSFGAIVNAGDGQLKLLAGHWEGYIKYPDEGFMFSPLQNLVYQFSKVSFELREDNNPNDITIR